MKVSLYRMSVMLVALLFCVSTVAAQADCPTIVQNALDIADKACSVTGRNQACYGNITLNAVPQAGASNFTFKQTGDKVNVADVQSLTLSSMDTATKQWGVALLRIQANLPDTLPGQNVTLLLFGDVQIHNSVPSTAATAPSPTPAQTASPVSLPITSDDKIEVWSAPLDSADIVVRLPPIGQKVQADGRDANSTWLHIQPVRGKVGWVLADSVTVEGDIESLPVLNPDGTAASQAEATSEATPEATSQASQSPTFGPMQAFYFKSGANDRPCSQAPDSGILIQSPKGAAGISLTVNGVAITLGSTAYLQAQPNGDMIMTVVEGHGTASAFGKTVTVPAGTRVRIPMDANLQASGVPGDPEPYTVGDIGGLPLPHLPDVITSASPLTTDEIRALKTPLAGSWLLTYDSAYIDVGCAADDYNGGFATDLSYDSSGAMLWYSYTLLPSGYGVYKSVPNPGATSPHLITMVVTSPTHIEGQNVWIVPGCATITNNFHLVLQKAAG